MDIDECCLMCLFCSRGVGGWDSRHASTFLPTFEDVLGLFTVHGVLFRIRKTCLPCGCDKFLNCSSRQQSTEVEKVIVFGCVCAWTTWRRPGDVVSSWAGVRHGPKTSFLRSVPVQGGSVSFV